MSLFGLYNIAQSALTASQAGLSVTGNNIANVNTPGYSRQEVILEIATPVNTAIGSIGMGVMASSVRRIYSSFIENQLLGQQQNQGRSAAMDRTWGRVEQVLNEHQGSGLSRPLADFFNAWSDLAAAPASPAARTVLLLKANALVTSASTIENSIIDTIKNANAGITDDVRQINTLAGSIAALNSQIVRPEAGTSGGQANELRDQRDAKLTALAALVDFASYENNDGAVTVTVGMRNLVSGEQTNAMSAVPNSDGDQQLFLDGIDITARIRGGDIGGLISSRDGIRENTLTGLRRLSASITQQVNSLHIQGFDLNGAAGGAFFNPLELAATGNSTGAAITAVITDEAALSLDEYRITFDATAANYTVSNKRTGAFVAAGVYGSGNTIALSGMDIVITGGVGPSDSFTVSPLTKAISSLGAAVSDPRAIAAASSAGGVPGDNVIASAISQLTGAAMSALGNETFSDYYSGVVSTAGAAKQTASYGLAFDNTLLSQLQDQRDSISGVSLDEEAARLMLYQRSYEAAARMIKTADEMMQALFRMI